MLAPLVICNKVMSKSCLLSFSNFLWIFIERGLHIYEMKVLIIFIEINEICYEMDFIICRCFWCSDYDPLLIECTAHFVGSFVFLIGIDAIFNYVHSFEYFTSLLHSCILINVVHIKTIMAVYFLFVNKFKI